MATYTFIVLTNPVDDHEDEYNRWHTEHIPDVVAIPGVRSGQRLRIAASLGDDIKYKYLAIYEVDADDPHSVLREIQDRADRGDMVVSDAMSLDLWAACYSPITPVVTADDD